MADNQTSTEEKQTTLNQSVTVELNVTTLTAAHSITDSTTDDTTDNATVTNNIENDDNVPPPTLQRQRTWVDGRIMVTQTNLLIVGYIRLYLVKSHYEPYEIEIVQIIVKSLGDIFNTKRLWSEMTQQKYNILIDWLRLNGAEFQNCALQQVNGIYTSTDKIHQGTIFAKVPVGCIMSMDIAKESSIGQKINLLQTTQQIQIRSQHTYLAAYLVLERQKEEKSIWFPYIQSLPWHFNEMPIYFDNEDLAQLKGSFTIQKINQRKESLQSEYDTLKELFVSEGISYDEFVWARLIVITRVFGLTINDNKSSGLVPWADLIDHAPPAPNRVKWTFDNRGQQFIVKANSNMKKDSELFVTYGRKCNSRFFVNYGFVLEQENMDNEAIMAFRVGGNRRLYQNLYVNEDEETEFQFSRLYNQRKVKEVFGFLRNLHADEKEQRMIQFMGANNTIIHPLSIGNETQVLDSLNEAAGKGLGKFDTSLEFDNELLEDKTRYALKSNNRNILLMRKGEKDVLMFYRELKVICMGLLNMTMDEIRKKLKGDEMFEDTKAPLMQYIQAVIIPLKQQERMIKQREQMEIERRKRELERQAAVEEKKEENDIGKKLEVINDKMEKMSKEIQGLLESNQEKDKQIKILNDKVNVLENKLMGVELKEEQNVNDSILEIETLEIETLETFFGCDEVDLPQYIQLFIDNGIKDIIGLKGITKDQLEALGIENMGHREQILSAIEKKLVNN